MNTQQYCHLFRMGSAIASLDTGWIYRSPKRLINRPTERSAPTHLAPVSANLAQSLSGELDRSDGRD